MMPKENKPLHSDITFLPPLKMILSLFDKNANQRELQRKAARDQKESKEKTVERLIEKLSEKDE